MDGDQSVEFVCEYVGFNKADSSVMELKIGLKKLLVFRDYDIWVKLVKI